MKSLLSFSTLVLVLTVSFAQNAPKKPAPAAPKPVQSSPLKNQLDSFSYAIGISMANFYRDQGIQNINSAMLSKALADHKAGKALMDENQCNTAILGYIQVVKSQKSAEVRKAGQAFLAANKNKPGVITTKSGLQYLILKDGTGPKPTLMDKVKVHYHGTLIDGTVFDSSVDRGEPLVLSVDGVISGWIEALQLMPVGSKWRLFIPSDLAYGDNDTGPAIKGGSTLIFEVELLEIVPKS
ncbi:MAG: FKBP-type peptidyl-prolyl cis-trans isomerase [Chitinophagaceae bacterium]